LGLPLSALPIDFRVVADHYPAPPHRGPDTSVAARRITDWQIIPLCSLPAGASIALHHRPLVLKTSLFASTIPQHVYIIYVTFTRVF